MTAAGKTMFEIYREGAGNRRVRAIYFTELGEHERDREIERAASGKTLFAGFLRDDCKAEAKAVIDRILQELDDDAACEPGEDELARRLAPYLAGGAAPAPSRGTS